MDGNTLEDLPSNSLQRDLDVNAHAVSQQDLAVEILDLNTNYGHSEVDANTLERNRVKRQAASDAKIKMLGLRVEESDKEPKIVDGVIPSVLRDKNFTLRLFGEGFTNDTVIAFTHLPEEYGTECRHLVQGEYKVKVIRTSYIYKNRI